MTVIEELSVPTLWGVFNAHVSMGFQEMGEIVQVSSTFKFN